MTDYAEAYREKHALVKYEPLEPTVPAPEHQVTAPNGSDGEPADDNSDAATSWCAVDLGPVLDGDAEDTAPTLLRRRDGKPLLYRGVIHSFHGEPEVAKGWVMLHACAQVLDDGGRVVYIDFEMSAERLVRARLVDTLGVDPEVVRRNLCYLRPSEPLSDAARADYDRVLEAGLDILIVDGLTEAYGAVGLDGDKNKDIAEFLKLVARPAVTAGAAVVLIDHVVKDRQTRGDWAIGGQHKRAGIDVAYHVKKVRQFGRGLHGESKLIIAKDRDGHVRGYGSKVAAVFHLDSGGDTAEAWLDPPATGDDADPDGDDFRPTWYMERLSVELERLQAAAEPDPDYTQTEGLVEGKAAPKRAAIRALVAEQYVEKVKDGRHVRYRSVRPYRQHDDRPDEGAPA